MKLKHLLLGALATVSLAFVGGAKADAYTINNEFNLNSWEGSRQVAVPNKIILHETANPRATGRNEATYMKNNWFNAHTTAIVGDGGVVYKVSPEGNISWGAGNANAYAPVQIELQHTNDPALFKANYKAYVDYTRDMGKKFGIPMTLDQGGSIWEKGVVSHQWVTDFVWGDHTDPYGYLAKMGVSKAKLAHDLANGVGGNTTPEKPKPSKPKEFKKGQNVFIHNGHKRNNGPVVPFIAGNKLWTQIGTITEVKKGTVNMYKIENSGKFVTYANAGDLVDLKEWAGEPAKPSTAKNQFTIGVDSIMLRAGRPSVYAPHYGTWKQGAVFKYDEITVGDGYVWIGGTDSNGTRIYLPIGPNDGDPNNTWGTLV